MATNNAINAPLPLVAGQGGTGLATLTNHGVMLGAATGNIAFAGPSASSNSILMGQGASADPAFLTNGTPYVTGISFNAGTNTLGNYVTQTSWTPSIAFGGGTTGITYTARLGWYTRIGELVFFWFYILLSNKGSSTGSATVTGFPFTTSANNGYVFPIVPSQAITLTAGNNQANIRLDTNSNIFSLTQSSTTGTTSSNMDNSHFSNNSNIQGTCFCAVQ